MALAACASGPKPGEGRTAAPPPVPPPSDTQDEAGLIRVREPAPGAVVHSPLRVIGEARGSWYFEASFPVTLLDGAGNVLAQQPAQAQGEWMTEAFVPFAATLQFIAPGTADGTLLLEKDNPSGLPEQAASLRVPVRFAVSGAAPR
jgi:hypothetical protein